MIQISVTGSALGFCLLLVGSAQGATSSDCDTAASRASRETGVPLSILRAVTLAETGRSTGGKTHQMQPWPWTIRSGAKGHWFKSSAAALQYLNQQIALGQTNIDIGCFQLNWRWHGENFATTSDMLDPQKNARYAANFLKDLFHETGEWRSAVGTYHSRTSGYAKAYLARLESLFEAHLAWSKWSQRMPEPSSADDGPSPARTATRFHLVGASRALLGRSASPLIGARR